jgi:transposase
MPKNQNVFTKEFMWEAVQIAQKSGKPQAHMARDLGITESTLHQWCTEAARGGEQAFPGSCHPPASEEERRRFCREQGIVRQERDIFTKARAIFSRSQG